MPLDQQTTSDQCRKVLRRAALNVVRHARVRRCLSMQKHDRPLLFETGIHTHLAIQFAAKRILLQLKVRMLLALIGRAPVYDANIFGPPSIWALFVYAALH